MNEKQIKRALIGTYLKEPDPVAWLAWADHCESEGRDDEALLWRARAKYFPPLYDAMTQVLKTWKVSSFNSSVTAKSVEGNPLRHEVVRRWSRGAINVRSNVLDPLNNRYLCFDVRRVYVFRKYDDLEGDLYRCRVRAIEIVDRDVEYLKNWTESFCRPFTI